STDCDAFQSPVLSKSLPCANSPLFEKTGPEVSLNAGGGLVSAVPLNSSSTGSPANRLSTGWSRTSTCTTGESGDFLPGCSVGSVQRILNLWMPAVLGVSLIEPLPFLSTLMLVVVSAPLGSVTARSNVHPSEGTISHESVSGPPISIAFAEALKLVYERSWTTTVVCFFSSPCGFLTVSVKTNVPRFGITVANEPTPFLAVPASGAWASAVVPKPAPGSLSTRSEISVLGT